MARLKRCLPLNQWFLSAVQEKWAAIWLEWNYPEERTKGFFKSGSKRCEVCLNVNETSTFPSTVVDETYIINQKFNCNDKCLVYLLTCNCCKNNTWVKLSTNPVLDGAIIKVTVGNIHVVKHVCNNTYMNIFAAAIIIVLQVMSQ